MTKIVGLLSQVIAMTWSTHAGAADQPRPLLSMLDFLAMHEILHLFWIEIYPQLFVLSMLDLHEILPFFLPRMYRWKLTRSGWKTRVWSSLAMRSAESWPGPVWTVAAASSRLMAPPHLWKKSSEEEVNTWGVF